MRFGTTSATYQCPDCRRAELFEVAEPAGETSDGDEWACTVCGAAVFVDPVLVSAPPAAETRPTRAA
ncbi:MAG TPA: hypothetical protein VI076_03595 [Actinopolymorphaceae bacterium]